MTWWNGNAVRYRRVGELTPMTTVTRTMLIPPRRASFAGGRTYLGYDPTSLLKTASVPIAAGGSSATAAATVTIAPPPAWAADGKALLMADGALAGRYVPIAGLTLGSAPDPCAKAVADRDTAWRAALSAVKP
jgi:hypothetical protein